MKKRRGGRIPRERRDHRREGSHDERCCLRNNGRIVIGGIGESRRRRVQGRRRRARKGSNHRICLSQGVGCVPSQEDVVDLP